MNNIVSQSVVALICMVIISSHQVLTLYLYDVQPSNVNMNCTSSCFKFNSIPKSYLRSNVQLHLLAGEHELVDKILVQNVINFSIVGQQKTFVKVSCRPGNGQIHVRNSIRVRIAGITFSNCGAQYSSSLWDYEYISTNVAVVIVYYRCIAIHITNTKFQNSYGHSIVAVSMKGVSTITNTSFFHTLLLNSANEITFAGILFDNAEFDLSAILPDNVTIFDSCSSCKLKTTLILEHCTFYNIDGKSKEFTLDNSQYNIGTATFINSGDSHLFVHVLNSNFVNCTCYTGSLISLHYNPYKNMSFLLHNVTIYNNKIVIVYTDYKFHALIELNGNIIPLNGVLNNSTETQVEFRYCSISNNIGIGYIIKLFKLPQALDISTYMYLNIDDCIFSYNEVANTFMAILNYFTVVSMSNSKYAYNKVCDLSLLKTVVRLADAFVRNAMMMPDEMCDHYEHVVFTGEKCAFFIICTNKIFFRGLNEFLFNSLYSSYFWIIDDHIVLEENTSLNFSSNSAGKAMIKIINQDSAYTRNGMVYFPLCPIQYVSYRGSLTKEFTNGKPSHFSLTFHGNSYFINSIAKTIVGKNLKDCEWLPESAFATLHPAAVASRFVHFDYQIKYPTGYPYAGCLCYKDRSIDCLTDDVGPVYPGQTIEIGFTIIESDVEYFYYQTNGRRVRDMRFSQGVLIKDNSLCQIDGVLKLEQTVSGDYCSYFNYTITFDQQGMWECSFVHYFQESYDTIILYNKYYIASLACPPGFLFINERCRCHPNLKKIMEFPNCDINNQSILRPGNVWIMYSNVTDEIMYTLNCPAKYCSTESSYVQLANPDQQCNNNRKGLMCGECVNGFSATFGSSRCKKCSNVWLTMIIAFMLVGLLLMLMLIIISFKIHIENANVTGFLLYVNIISLNNFIIFANNISSFPTSLVMIVISFLNLDLGFQLCFYDGMTDYTKLWLQSVFPVYFILLTSLLLVIRKHINCIKRITRHNGNVITSIILLMCCNKIIAACQSLLLYNHLSYLENGKSKYLWSAYPSIPVFDAKYLLYFLFCLILIIVLLMINISIVLSKKCMQGNYFIYIFDAHQTILKEKHSYWPVLELTLRLITMVFSVLNKQLSVLLNTIVIIMFVCCLGIVSPFKDTKNTFVECTFAFNLVCVFLCASYYGDSKTVNHYMFVDILIFLVIAVFIAQVIYHNNVKRFNKVYSCINCCIQGLQKGCIKRYHDHANL